MINDIDDFEINTNYIIFSVDYNGNNYVVLSDSLLNDDVLDEDESDIYFAKRIISEDGKEYLEAAEDSVIPHLKQMIATIKEIGGEE